MSLELNPSDFKWVDLYLEYRCLSNHNDKYAYGNQLIKGKKKFTRKPLPKWKRRDEQDEMDANNSKQEYGMASAIYKTTGEVIDTEFKDSTRDIIIACNDGTKESLDTLIDEREMVIEYCNSDTKYLEPMFNSFISEYKRLLGDRYNSRQLLLDMKVRANYAILTARMERIGYPIDLEKTRNFSDQVGNIIWECQHDINSQFDVKFFEPNVKKRPFDLSFKQTPVRDYIRQYCKDSGFKVNKWMLTKGGKKGIKDLSLSLKAFQKPLSFSHNYPKGNFIAQMQRYLKLKQGLNGFVPTKEGSKKKTFWHSVGKDCRVRPYMGIYIAQSARSQPSATSFIPLKSAWMRNFISPSRGRAICGIDYSSEEFLLAALLSGDGEMLKAYQSGDVYLSFGKSIGYIPGDATKESHKEKRDNCKAVVLGLSYDMSEFGLAINLSEKFGRKVEPEEALKWIEKHKRTYRTFWRWKEHIQKKYKNDKHIRLADGYYMWGDNDNFRSVGNVPVQGLGSCIMRKAVEFAYKEGLDVIYTLHDAIYIEYDIKFTGTNPVSVLAVCMDKAFRHYFNDTIKPIATCYLDADVWSPSFPLDTKYYSLDYRTINGKENMGVKQQQIYIDPRGEEEYNKYKKHFTEQNYETMEF